MSDNLIKDPNKPPEIEQMPPSCPPCDAMIALGFLSGTMQDAPSDKKNEIKSTIDSLEKGSKSAVDAITDVLVTMGADEFNKSVDRFNMLVFESFDKAKSRLIADGKLNPDGTVVE